MDTTPIQGHAALVVAIIAVCIVLAAVVYSLLPEKQRATDHTDDH